MRSTPFAIFNLFKPSGAVGVCKQVPKKVIDFAIVITKLRGVKRRCPHSTGILIRGVSRVSVNRTNHVTQGDTGLSNPRIQVVFNFLDPVLIVCRNKEIREIELRVSILLTGLRVNLANEFRDQHRGQLM